MFEDNREPTCTNVHSTDLFVYIGCVYIYIYIYWCKLIPTMEWKTMASLISESNPTMQCVTFNRCENYSCATPQLSVVMTRWQWFIISIYFALSSKVSSVYEWNNESVSEGGRRFLFSTLTLSLIKKVCTRYKHMNGSVVDRRESSSSALNKWAASLTGDSMIKTGLSPRDVLYIHSLLRHLPLEDEEHLWRTWMMKRGWQWRARMRRLIMEP